MDTNDRISEKDRDRSDGHEYEYRGACINGFLMIFVTFILLPALMALTIIYGGDDNQVISVRVTMPLFILFVLGCVGYFTQEPNVARVMIFFGKYKGTCRKVGLSLIHISEPTRP